MKASQSSRIARGLASQAAAQSTQILVRVVEAPLLITFWGLETYGEWLILTAIPVYLSMVDGGLSAASIRRITMLAAGGDRATAQRVFDTAWLAIAMVSVAALLGLFAVFTVFPVFTGETLTRIGPDAAVAVLLILSANILVGFQLNLLHSGFNAEGQYYKATAWRTFNKLLTITLFATLVTLGMGPQWAALSYPVSTVGVLIAARLHMARVAPWLRYRLAGIRRDELRILFVPSAASMLVPIAHALNIQGTRLVIGYLLGPVALASFVPMYTLARLVLLPCRMSEQIMQPEMGLSHGEGDLMQVRALLKRSAQINLWVAALAAGALAGLGSWIFDLWLGGNVKLQYTTFVVLIAGAVGFNLWNSLFQVALASNRHAAFTVWFLFIYGPLCLVGVAAAAPLLNLLGAALTLLICELILVVSAVYMACRHTQIRPSALLTTIVSPPTYVVGYLQRMLASKSAASDRD